MPTKKPHTLDNFGYNSHTIHDIRMIVDVTDNGPFKGGEDLLAMDFESPDSENIAIESESGLAVHLKRDTKVVGDEVRDVFSIDRVEADKRDDINKFVHALEELEATRARQILNSWQDAGWSIDRLQQLSNRRIMVADGLLERWSGGNVTDSVQLERAFENQDSAVITALVGTRVTAHLPEADCLEYIAGSIGPYEFTGPEGASIARDVWNTFRDEPKIMDCMILGLIEDGHIQQRPNWRGWGSHYPFGFLPHGTRRS